METGNTATGGGGGDDPDCSGYGETWGQNRSTATRVRRRFWWWAASLQEAIRPSQSKPPIGSVILLVLALRGFTGLASAASPNLAGRVPNIVQLKDEHSQSL